MQELGRILEEIRLDRADINTPPGGDADKIIRMCYKRVEKIIRKHMNDADLDVPFGDCDGIVAWQPLPEPYKPDKEGRTCRSCYEPDIKSMEPIEAVDIIKRMYKGKPTTEQIIALNMAYEALEKQQQSE